MNEAIWERFSERSRTAFYRAQAAASLNYGTMSPEHLLMGIIAAGGIGSYALREAGVDIERLAKGSYRAREGGDQAMREAMAYALNGLSLDDMKQMRDWVERGGKQRKRFDDDVVQMLEKSVLFADANGSKKVKTQHLVLAIMHEPTDVVKKALQRYGVRPKRVTKQTRKIMKEGLDAFKKRKIAELNEQTSNGTTSSGSKKPGRVQAVMQQLAKQ